MTKMKKSTGKVKPMPVASAMHRGTHIETHLPNGKNIKFLNREEFEPPFIINKDLLNRLIRQQYTQTITYHQDNINRIFTGIYGHPVKLSSSISEVILKIKQMTQQGAPVEEIAKVIAAHLGYRQFHRLDSQGQPTIPVGPTRLEKAYQLVKEKRSFIEVEDALYL